MQKFSTQSMSGVAEQLMMSVKLNLNVRGYLATNAIARQRYVLVLCVACCMLHMHVHVHVRVRVRVHVCVCVCACACSCVRLHVRV